MRIDRCASCGAECIWVQNEATGKRFLVDVKRIRRFRIVVQQGPTPIVRSEEVYQSHFETCPHAAYWSGRRRSATSGGPGASPGVTPDAPTPGSPAGADTPARGSVDD